MIGVYYYFENITVSDIKFIERILNRQKIVNRK